MAVQEKEEIAEEVRIKQIVKILMQTKDKAVGITTGLDRDRLYQINNREKCTEHHHRFRRHLHRKAIIETFRAVHRPYHRYLVLHRRVTLNDTILTTNRETIGHQEKRQTTITDDQDPIQDLDHQIVIITIINIDARLVLDVVAARQLSIIAMIKISHRYALKMLMNECLLSN